MLAPKYILKRIYNERDNLRELKSHQKRLKSIQEENIKKKWKQKQQQFDNKLVQYTNSRPALSFNQMTRYQNINQDNARLLDKLVSMEKQKQKNIQKQNKALSMNQSKVQTMIYFTKKKEINQIRDQNQKLAQRLDQCKPCIQQKQFEDEFFKHLQFSNNIRRAPNQLYKDPYLKSSLHNNRSTSNFKVSTQKKTNASQFTNQSHYQLGSKKGSKQKILAKNHSKIHIKTSKAHQSQTQQLKTKDTTAQQEFQKDDIKPSQDKQNENQHVKEQDQIEENKQTQDQVQNNTKDNTIDNQHQNSLCKINETNESPKQTEQINQIDKIVEQNEQLEDSQKFRQVQEKSTEQKQQNIKDEDNKQNEQQQNIQNQQANNQVSKVNNQE